MYLSLVVVLFLHLFVVCFFGFVLLFWYICKPYTKIREVNVSAFVRSLFHENCVYKAYGWLRVSNWIYDDTAHHDTTHHISVCHSDVACISYLIELPVTHDLATFLYMCKCFPQLPWHNPILVLKPFFLSGFYFCFVL